MSENVMACQYSDLPITKRPGKGCLVCPLRVPDVTNNGFMFSMDGVKWPSSLQSTDGYFKEFLTALKSREAALPSIHGKSPQLHCRKYMVDFLCSICELLKLNTCTVHLALRVLDSFMDAHSIEAPQQSLVILGCVWVAAKFEEKEICVPRASELNAIVSDQYAISSFAAVEGMILRYLKWRLAAPTAATFCHFFSLVALPLSATDNKDAYRRLFESYKLVVSTYLDMTLKEFEFARMSPSKVACACIAATRRSMNLVPLWTAHLENLTGYNFLELVPILDIYLWVPERPTTDASFLTLDCTPESGYLSDSGSDELSQSWSEESDSSLSSARSIKRRQEALTHDQSKRRKN